ncbi:MAG: two-component system, OmpR family, sensor histidine kinase KdpD [Candidatus Atribacteria bacterium]|nr:two-component system, OmpR family, sensor histidine kinase KdpD [Candidatus Atribacteria bacterium]
MVIFRNKEHIYIVRYMLITTCMIAVATGIGWIFRYIAFPETNIVIVYLLFVLMTARFTRGYAYGIVASVIATFTFNYFFTKPYFTFSVNDPTYFITFAIMTVTAFITSTLTSKAKQNALEAQEKEAETSALFQLTNQLTDAANLSDIASIITDTISGIMNCRAACLCFDESGQPEQSFIQQQCAGKQVWRKVDDTAEMKHRIEGLRTAFDVGDEFCDWPIYGREAILGVLRIPKETATTMSESQMRLLHSMIESTALAMDRFRSTQKQQKSREEVIQERYRSNLLRAISHDLRTPLSGIMGTSEMLMDMIDLNDPRYFLAKEIYKDADWLHSLVENILSLTRLQDGRLTITKQLEAVEEVIGSAVNHIMKRSPEYEITINIPEEVLLVPMDAKLIEQVLVNLLDNAVKHTPSDREISVSVIEDKIKNIAVFSVTDQGCGIAASDLPHIFQMFYITHSRQADSQRGVGLGLTICEVIIKAHGGTIEGHNRADEQGAEFVFTLPMEVQNNAEQE